MRMEAGMGQASKTLRGGVLTARPSAVSSAIASAGHVQKAAAILGDVGGVDGVDAEIDRLAPRAW